MWNSTWQWFKDAIWQWYGPPDVDNETELLVWLSKILGLLDWAAAKTSSQIDDKVVDQLEAITRNPAKWKVVYGLLVKFFGDGKASKKAIGESPEVPKAAADLGIPLELLVYILAFLMKFLNKN